MAEILNPFGKPEPKKQKPFRKERMVPVCPMFSMSIPVPATVAGGSPTAMLLPVGCIEDGCACYSESRKGCGLPVST